jgi:TonB-linked SusC/RagA family outer membrane protein
MRSKFKWIFTLLVALTMQFSFAQKTVTGKVSDASGPLPGANVVVKGTKNATSTDFDGTYSIKAKEGDVLVFSFVGKEGKVATVGAGNVYNATLNAVEELTTVVVTALGIKKTKNSVTSAQQTISNRELTQAASPNIVQSLAGKVSGLQVNTTSNGVKSSTSIILRGLRTITGTAQALVVIDNAISTAAILAQLPPEVVENLTVIKGQQGAALYGEQGSNGVIIVTTKKGTKSEKPVISINSSIDFENISFVPERQTRYGQGWYSDNTWKTPSIPNTPTNYSTFVPFENGNWGPAYDDPRFAGTSQPVGLPQADGKFLVAPYKLKENNIKSFFKTGILLQNGVSLNMGGENGYAFISVNRQTSDFVVTNDKLVRTSFLFKGGKKMGKFSFDGTANYNEETTSQTDSDLYRDLQGTATNIPTELFTNPSNKTHWTPYNNSPYWTIANSRADSKINTLNATFTLGYTFNKNISVNYTANGVFRNSISEYHNNGDLTDQIYDFSYLPSTTYSIPATNILSYRNDFGITPINSQYLIGDESTRRFYADLLFNFDYKLTESIGLKANLGNNIQDNRFSIATNGGLGLAKPGIYNSTNIITPGGTDGNTPLEFYDTTNGNKLDNRKNTFRRVAFFGNIDLSYKDFLFVNATSRYEKSSVVKNSTFYPSIGVSFIPTLAFEALKGNKILNYIKLNASYVKTGNSSPVAPTQTAGPVAVPGVGYPFGSLSSFVAPVSQTDPNVRPEFVTTKEFGATLGFFEDRLTLSTSVYNSITNDLISNATASSVSGLASVRQNIGVIENKGVDFDLGISPFKKGSFKWDVKLNYSAFTTTVVSLAGGVDEISLNPIANAGVFAIVGEQFPFLKTNKYVRDGNGSIVVNAQGLPLFTSTLEKAGKVNPDYILGLTNSFEYKGLRLTAVVDYRSGGSVLAEIKRELAFIGGLLESGDIDRTAPYVVPNSVQINAITGASTANVTPVNPGAPNSYNANGSYFFGNYRGVAENFLIDATSFKLRELALSYTIPSKFLEGIGISSFKFGVNARNLVVLLGNPFKGKSSYSNQGYADPETNNTAELQRNANATGISNQQQYPSTRTIGFSINVTF